MAISLFHMSGSSPYTWGARKPANWINWVCRITPIYMGSTLTKFLYICHSIGSPPYTWGALDNQVTVTVDDGITPIYMGSTMNFSDWVWHLKDHPHIHGEHCNRTER